ncbi:MAG: hypothetical protein ACFB21_16330, partial [Opitutales bacterium]
GRASLRGFHAFKPPFITLPLMNGISLTLLHKNDGNTTVDVVVRNYFQPSNEHIQQIFQKQMPALFKTTLKSDVAPNPHEMVRLIETITENNWRERQRELLELVRDLPETRSA